MNLAVICAKDYKKSIKGLIESPKDDIKVLHTETIVKKDFIDVIQNINPHILVILRGAKYKDITEEEFLQKLLAFNTRIRIIYIYGLVADETAYENTVSYLKKLGITDIIKGRITPTQVHNIILNPIKEAEVTEKDSNSPTLLEDIEDLGLDDLLASALDEIEETEKDISTAVTPAEAETDTDMDIEEASAEAPAETETDTATVATPTEAPQKPSFLKNDNFDFFIIERETEYEKKITDIVGNIIIGVTSLLHRSGCTFSSIELAKVIQQNGFDACVVLSDENTYSNLSSFYLNDTDIFFVFENIKIYSPKSFSIAKGEHKIIINDLGILGDSTLNEFEETQIKIMMCDGSEWNLPILENYINENKTKPYLKQINFCFQNIGKARFSELYRAIVRKGLNNVFRLTTSEYCYQPSSENTKAYRSIMQTVFASKNNTKERGFKKLWQNT